MNGGVSDSEELIMKHNANKTKWETHLGYYGESLKNETNKINHKNFKIKFIERFKWSAQIRLSTTFDEKVQTVDRNPVRAIFICSINKKDWA